MHKSSAQVTKLSIFSANHQSEEVIDTTCLRSGRQMNQKTMRGQSISQHRSENIILRNSEVLAVGSTQ